MRPTFTLTAGLSYALELPPVEKNGKQVMLVDSGDNPIVFQDSTAVPVCKVARASQHQTFRAWARKSKTGSGWWYGLKLHRQCAEEG